MNRSHKNKVSDIHKTFVSPLERVQTTVVDSKTHVKKPKVFEMTPQNNSNQNTNIFKQKQVRAS